VSLIHHWVKVREFSPYVLTHQNRLARWRSAPRCAASACGEGHRTSAKCRTAHTQSAPPTTVKLNDYSLKMGPASLLRGSPSLVNGARLRTSSLRGSWVRIPPPALSVSFPEDPKTSSERDRPALIERVSSCGPLWRGARHSLSEKPALGHKHTQLLEKDRKAIICLLPGSRRRSRTGRNIPPGRHPRGRGRAWPSA
jgi:hypothetical protein